MTAHVVYPALDPERRRRVLARDRSRARERMGYAVSPSPTRWR
jgi:hypothetical protein